MTASLQQNDFKILFRSQARRGEMKWMDLLVAARAVCNEAAMSKGRFVFGNDPRRILRVIPVPSVLQPFRCELWLELTQTLICHHLCLNTAVEQIADRMMTNDNDI